MRASRHVSSAAQAASVSPETCAPISAGAEAQWSSATFVSSGTGSAPWTQARAVHDERRAGVVVHAHGDGTEAGEVVLAQPDLLGRVGEHGRARVLAGHDAAGRGRRPEQRVAADRGAAKLEEVDALLALDEELHAEREPEPVGERRLLEDHHRLGVAAGAAEDRPGRA